MKVGDKVVWIGDFDITFGPTPEKDKEYTIDYIKPNTGLILKELTLPTGFSWDPQYWRKVDPISEVNHSEDFISTPLTKELAEEADKVRREVDVPERVYTTEEQF